MGTWPRTVLAYRRALCLALYLELGDARSIPAIRAVWTERGMPGDPPALKTLRGWSSKYGWTAQARARDEQVRDALVAGTIESAAETARQHAALARALRSAAAERLRKLTEAGLDDIPAAALPAYVRTAVDVERLTMGLDDERRTLAASLASRAWAAFRAVTDRPEIGAGLRAAMLDEYRGMLLAVLRADGDLGAPPELEAEEDAPELTAGERAAVSVALEAARRGMPLPDYEGYPALPERGGYGSG